MSEQQTGVLYKFQRISLTGQACMETDPGIQKKSIASFADLILSCPSFILSTEIQNLLI